MLKSTLLEAIQAAAAEMRRFIDLDFKISNKEGVNNLVTEVDHASEKAIMDTIRKNYPDHHILTEESGDLVQDSQYKWIIDPIDGTVNFAHRIPICCISIALEHNGKIILGAIYNPYINELFVESVGAVQQ
jgi:myo-inositol-1(or 4)-monophosphatase